MTQLNQVKGVATSIYTGDDGMTRIIYHGTPVVSFNDSNIVLNSGGWETATTKNRMNQASKQFRLGYQVYQKDFTWFVKYNNKEMLFYDNMMLNRY